MTTVSVGLQPDVSSVSSNSASVSSNTFGSIMDGLSLVSGAFGPTVAASFSAAGNTSGATIASATSNAIYGSSTAMAGGSTMGLTSGANYYGGTGTSMGLTSGTGYASTGTTSTGSVSTDVESILAETATSQSYLIGIQAMMGQQQSTFTAISNALNVKYSMERSAIQNFRS